jgi:hypothetical protein
MKDPTEHQIHLKREYKLLLKQVTAEWESGVRCYSRTNEQGQEEYWIVDIDKRICSGYRSSKEAAWCEYLKGEK